ncbi:hypothetical protein [Microbacterium capsulatum]|uniref:Uncharacterized protein n=1 Tax=Microbacterium capsulatum TaxID=3041921 RepID=A0ABU0XHY2_9MICO|nr:hypothetical protein [Microbacterium sp. ASV81]MDQ4213750.1 hypothetical protein [Microbacterium sp. ASV81]
MADEIPRGLAERFFRLCLYLLGGALALWATVWLIGQFWGWLLIIGIIAAVLCVAVAVYRYWWGRW